LRHAALEATSRPTRKRDERGPPQTTVRAVRRTPASPPLAPAVLLARTQTSTVVGHVQPQPQPHHQRRAEASQCVRRTNPHASSRAHREHRQDRCVSPRLCRRTAQNDDPLCFSRAEKAHESRKEGVKSCSWIVHPQQRRSGPSPHRPPLLFASHASLTD